MATEPTRCKACGQELTGRDVYEGTCKSCRAEAVLGAPVPAKRVRPSAPPPPLPAARRAAPAPDDRIALETSAVDLEADTREIHGVAVELGGLPIADSGSESEIRNPESEMAASDAPADDLTIRFPDANAEAKPDLQASIRHSSRPLTLPASTPAPAGGSAGAASPRWPAMGRPSTGEDSANLLSLRLEGDAAEARPNRIAAPDAPPQFAARPPAATDRPDLAEEREPEPPRHRVAPVPTLEFPEPEAEPEPRDPQPPERIHPTHPKPEPVSLDTEKPDGRLQSRLEQLSAQVEQITRDLAGTRKASPSPFGFGFRAFFGFVLGAGALAVVAVGLLAVAGLLFYPPAFEFLRRVLGHILGGP